MTRLPVVSGKQLCKILEKKGYLPDYQRGSHMILRHEKPPHRRLTIPVHKEIAKGTLRAILRQTGVTVDEFRKLM